MDQLIEALTQRDAQITERQKYLEKFLEEYKELQDERQLIAALLTRYGTPSTNISSSPPPSYQKSILNDHPQNTQTSNKIKTRQSPGETGKHVDHILSQGESHSIVSLVRRINEVLGIRHSDSTIGVVLRRGLDEGKYKRDGSLWSMVLNQDQLLQKPEGTLVENDEESTNDGNPSLLQSMRTGDFEENV